MSELETDQANEAAAPDDLRVELQAEPADAATQPRPDPSERADWSVLTVGEPFASPRVLLGFPVLKQALDHALSETETEVGGVLLGESFAGRRGVVVELTAALPAHTHQAGLGHVTFSHEAWNDIYRQVDALGPELRILGWYHSHPGFGIFLSQQDRFIQSNFFAAPQNVALVIDPLFERLGLFGWRKEAIVSLGGVRLLVHDEQLPAARELVGKLGYEVTDEEKGMASLAARVGRFLGGLARRRE